MEVEWWVHNTIFYVHILHK